MTAYSLAVQADVRKRMSPPNRQDVPQIFKELGIHRSTLYQWRSNWRLQGELALVAAMHQSPRFGTDAIDQVLQIDAPGLGGSRVFGWVCMGCGVCGTVVTPGP